MTNDCSDTLDDWYTTESEADVSEREEVLDRMRSAVHRTVAWLGKPRDDSPVSIVLTMRQLRAAIALLEAEPREPDGWAEGNWLDKMRRHRVISLYATREADSDMPVYIGGQPEVEL